MAQFNRVRIQDIYLEALELLDSERRRFIDKACAGNPDCIRKVEALLEVAARPSILDNPVANLGITSVGLLDETIDGRYLIDRELPHDGMGKVYVARDLQLPGRFVIIKVLPHASTIDPDALRRFKREVQALTLIDHPGIVSVFGAGEVAEGKPYVAMQYIDGPTLRSEIPSDGMEVKRAAALIRQIGAAVSHVHDKGILHLDLKPANIMLQPLSDGTEVVKIVDFGIARIKDSVRATGAINTVPIGTLAYMSPEQLRPGETLTAGSDVYSMAVVACEMLTGERAQQPEPASQGRWPPRGVELPKGVAVNARNLIAQALSFDPKNRPQNAKKFGDELAEVLLKADHDGLKGLRWQGWKEWQSITKWVSIVGGILVLAVLSYGIYKYLVRTALPPPITSTTQTKGFNYWLTVQRTRDGKDYEAPDKSNGNDTFHTGDKFQLNVLSLDSGYLYIFNERPPEEGSTSFRLIYPKRAVNDGSTSVGGNQPIQSDWITFHGPPGTDNYWIVWSASPLTELESAKNEALKHPQAGLTDQNLVKVKEYLNKLDTEVNAKASRMSASQEVQVRKRHDIVLTFAEFKHR
jgi:serine/threonine protein kinase